VLLPPPPLHSSFVAAALANRLGPGPVPDLGLTQCLVQRLGRRIKVDELEPGPVSDMAELSPGQNLDRLGQTRRGTELGRDSVHGPLALAVITDPVAPPPASQIDRRRRACRSEGPGPTDDAGPRDSWSLATCILSLYALLSFFEHWWPSFLRLDKFLAA
jgi:hypothetical protein